MHGFRVCAVSTVARRVVLRGRSPDRIPEDPRAVWLSRLDTDSRPSAASHFERFMRWIHTKPSWEYVTPRDLLIRHIQAEDGYVVLELVQEYVGQLRCSSFSIGYVHHTGRNEVCAVPGLNL